MYYQIAAAAAAAKSLQSCPTLCDPIDGSPPGSPVPGILQARTLEWVAIAFSSAWKWKVEVKSLSGVRLFPTPWREAPPFMGFSRQGYWGGVPLPSLITRSVPCNLLNVCKCWCPNIQGCFFCFACMDVIQLPGKYTFMKNRHSKAFYKM